MSSPTGEVNHAKRQLFMSNNANDSNMSVDGQEPSYNSELLQQHSHHDYIQQQSRAANQQQQIHVQQESNSEGYAYQHGNANNDISSGSDGYHLIPQQQHRFVQQQSNSEQQHQYHQRLEDLAEIAQLSQQQRPHYSQIQRQVYPIGGKF